MFDGNAPAKTHARQSPCPPPHAKISTEIFSVLQKNQGSKKCSLLTTFTTHFTITCDEKTIKFRPFFAKTHPKTTAKNHTKSMQSP
jgi:hypothetical protein